MSSSRNFSSPSQFGSLFRICFILIIFLLNFVTLFHLLFKRNSSKVCVHSFTYGLTLIIINVFISIWIPYLFSSYYYETVWPLIQIDTHCMIQQAIPLMISTILMIIFCFQKIHETFATNRAKVICVFLSFVWILPQTIYLTFSYLSSPKENGYYFMDVINSTINNNNQEQGILFCIDKLDSGNVRQMTWHYVTIVVPLTSLYIICTGAKRFAKTFPGQLLNVNCDCRFDVIVFTCHYINFIWLLLFRPLLALSALIHGEIRLRKEPLLDPSSIEVRSMAMELGSHFILLIISILLPFSQRFGLFSNSYTSTQGTYHVKSYY